MTLTPEQLVTLKQRVAREHASAIQRRHLLHGIPELAGQESKTRAHVVQVLESAGLTPRPPLIGTDVIADLEVDSPVRICLRADMDALPIEEQTGREYASEHAGRMHACGHDAHTAILLSAAHILSELREQLPVSVRFVFQPGEEIEAMGRELVAAGACDGCAAAYALHGWPGLPRGAVACREGPLMATGAHLRITFRGRGCHGSAPELGRNPIPAAAECILRLGQLHRELNAASGAVVSACGVDAGQSGNVIPDIAVVTGTARYLSAELHSVVEARIRQAATSAAAEHGVQADVEYDTRYRLPVINSGSGYRHVCSTADRVLGPECRIEPPGPSMGMEDFAFFLEACGGAMFWLGLGERHPPLHRNDFDFDDRAMTAGILMMCALALAHPVGPCPVRAGRG